MAAGRPSGAEARRFVRAIDDESIVAAIDLAELRTTGQIRVHISHRKQSDVEAAARAQFTRLGMEKLPDRNAVLIYVQPRTHAFFVLADSGLNDVLEPGALAAVAGTLSAGLRAGDPTTALEGAIARVGRLLTNHFPLRRGVRRATELPDDVTRD